MNAWYFLLGKESEYFFHLSLRVEPMTRSNNKNKLVKKIHNNTRSIFFLYTHLYFYIHCTDFKKING